MFRYIIVALALVAVMARPQFKMKGAQQPLSMLEETTQAQHEGNIARVRKNAEYTHETYHSKTDAMTRPEIDMDKLAPKARKRMARAQARDATLYGENAEAFAPPPGHDMFFDFEGFNAYAEAHTKSVRHQLKRTEHHHKQHRAHSNTTGLVNKKFLTACFEINVCATDVATGGAAAAAKAGLGQNVTSGAFDTCGQLGFSGTATLETEAGKQKLTLSAAVNLGISFKAFGASLTIYAGGQADWEFEILAKTPYHSVYDALFSAVKDMIENHGTGKSTVPKAVLERAAAVRKDLAAEQAEKTKGFKLTTGKQDDELTGMVKIHYAALNEWTSLIQTMTFTQAQAALHYVIYKYVYVPPTKDLTAAFKKKTIDEMITKDQFPCAKLIKSQGTDNALFATLLKYGVVLDKKDRKETVGWLWNNEGSSENSKNSIPAFYPEIWPKDEKHLDFIKKQMLQWQEYFKKISPTDYGKTEEITDTIRDPVTKKVTTFKRVVNIQKMSDTTQNDACTKARRMFQILSMNSEAIQSTLDGEFKPSKAQFKMTSISITGFVGATFGSGRMGFCTNDSNSVQFKFSKVYTWAPGDGWDCGDWDGQLWFAFAYNSFFQVQVAIPMQTMKFWTAGKANFAGSEDNPWFFRLHFSLPNGFVASDGAISPSVTAVQGVGTAVLSLLNGFYQKWKAVKNAEKAEVMSKFKDAVWSIMDKKKYAEVKGSCVKAGAIKAADKEDGSIWAGIAKATGAAAVKQGLTAILAAIGLKFGSLTEVGIQGNFHSVKGKTQFAPQIDLGTSFFTKVDLSVFIFYLIQGEYFELKPPLVALE